MGIAAPGGFRHLRCRNPPNAADPALPPAARNGGG